MKQAGSVTGRTGSKLAEMLSVMCRNVAGEGSSCLFGGLRVATNSWQRLQFFTCSRARGGKDGCSLRVWAISLQFIEPPSPLYSHLVLEATCADVRKRGALSV